MFLSVGTVALQWYAGFCYRAKWISRMHTYTTLLWSSLRPQSQASRSPQSTEPFPCATLQAPIRRLFHPGSCTRHLSLPTHPSLPYPQPCVHTAVLPISSIPALQIGFSLLYFQIPHTCINIWYLSFSFWLPSVSQILGPSTSLNMTQFHSFLKALCFLGNYKAHPRFQFQNNLAASLFNSFISQFVI